MIDDIRSYLKQHGGGATVDRLKPDESLLDSGVVDSAVMIDLIAYLESTFGVQVPDEDMMPENFETLRAITDYVERKLGKAS